MLAPNPFSRLPLKNDRFRNVLWQTTAQELEPCVELLP